MSSRVLQKGINRITQGYKTTHKGVDLGREHITGEPVIAHSDGVVVAVATGHKNNKGSSGTASYGNFVKIRHNDQVESGNDQIETLYAHLASVSVEAGEKVKKGQVIGKMGNTGNSYGIHLHFEVRKNNVRIDPTPYLDADLPLPKYEHISVTYQVYTNRWLEEVVDCNESNSRGYAGITRVNMEALKAKPQKGVLRYRVHLLDEKRWLPWVTNYDDYAGNIGWAIDAVQMELQGVDGYEVQYRVSPTNSTKWYGWCTGLKDATGDGYAGVYGKPIDCIQIKIVRK